MAGRTRGTKLSYVLVPVEDRKSRLIRVTDAQFHGLAKVVQPFVVRSPGEPVTWKLAT